MGSSLGHKNDMFCLPGVDCVFLANFPLSSDLRREFLFLVLGRAYPVFLKIKIKKSAFAKFYFYFPLLLHYFVKNQIKMTFEMEKNTHKKKQTTKCYHVLNQFYIARRTKNSSFIHVRSVLQSFTYVKSALKKYNIHARNKTT